MFNVLTVSGQQHHITGITHTTALSSVQGASQQQQQHRLCKTSQQLSEWWDQWSGDQWWVIIIQEHMEGGISRHWDCHNHTSSFRVQACIVNVGLTERTCSCHLHIISRFTNDTYDDFFQRRRIYCDQFWWAIGWCVRWYAMTWLRVSVCTGWWLWPV